MSEKELNFVRKEGKYEELLVNFLENATFDGLPNIAKAKNWIIRIVWIIILLTSGIYCSYSK